jgi:methylenetetrahydrofolate reductase (NADPH)
VQTLDAGLLVGQNGSTHVGNEFGEAGIKGLHIYTLNLEKGARMLLEELQLEGQREQIAPLPWRPALTP